MAGQDRKRSWFLSYNSRDAALTEGVEAAVRARQPDLNPFYAPKSLRAGGYWLPVLSKEIAKAEAFVLLVAGNGLGPWQVLEYYEALDRRVKDQTFPVLLMLLDGQAAPGLPFLRQLHWIVTPDFVGEETIGRLLAAVEGHADRPHELWRHTAPYRGLLAMTEADSDYFFGRHSETVAVLNTLAEQPDRLPVLLGNSGVGKSSLAQAGVLAALKRQSWPDRAWVGQTDKPDWPDRFARSRSFCFLTLQPGTTPLKALVHCFFEKWHFAQGDPKREALQAAWVAGLLDGSNSIEGLINETDRNQGEAGFDPPSGYLLYVDQGEELYVRAEEGQRRRFSVVLAQALTHPRWMALMSLRADFTGELQADDPLFAAHVKVDVPPLREDALRTVVAGPAERLSASFETPRLVDDIARRAHEESAADAGALTLLSYLMEDMWRDMVARGDGALRLPAQSIELGRVLAERADEYLRTNRASEERLRRVLFRLVNVRDDGEPTRRRALRSEFTDEEWRLVSKLADQPHRLLVTAHPEGRETYAEVAHEAIFRRWDRLNDWIKSEREFLVWKTTLEGDRRRWEASEDAGRDDARLRGRRLASAENWLAERAKDLAPADRAFIAASTSNERIERERIERERLERDRDRTLRLRLLTGTAAIAIALFAFSAWQWLQEKQLRDLAEDRLTLARGTLKVQVAAVTEDLQNDSGIQNRTILRLLDSTESSFDKLLSHLKDDARFGGDRAEMLSSYGTAYVINEDGQKAETRFDKSLKQFSELLEKEPSELKWRRGVAFQLDQLGQTHKRDELYDQALQEYEESLRLRKSIVEDRGNDWEAHRDVAASQYDLGEYFMSIQNPARARELFIEAQANVDRALSLIDKDEKGLRDLDWRRARILVSLSEAYRVFLRNDQKSHALTPAERETFTQARKDALIQALGLRRLLYIKNRYDREIKRDLSWAYQFIGNLEYDDKNVSAAEISYRKSFDLRCDAIKIDPSDFRAKSDLGWAAINYGIILRELGRYDDARRQLKMAADFMKLVYSRPNNKANAQRRRDFFRAELIRGDLEMSDLKPQQALIFYQEVSETLKNFNYGRLTKISEKSSFRLLTIEAHRKIAQAWLLGGDQDAAAQALDDALLEQDAAYSKNHDGAAFQAEWRRVNGVIDAVRARREHPEGTATYRPCDEPANDLFAENEELSLIERSSDPATNVSIDSPR